MKRVALIDGDVLVYEASFAAQKTGYTYTPPNRGNKQMFSSADEAKETLGAEVYKLGRKDGSIESQVHVFPERIANVALQQRLHGILEAVATPNYHLYLSGKDNFREKVAVTKGYKENRKDMVKPVHFEYVKSLLLKQGAIVASGEEADDLLGINQNSSTVICTIDKDLKMIPGLHYNWNEQRKFKISKEAGLFYFFKQLLTGDSTDNIPGLKGWGDKKASEILKLAYPCVRRGWEAVAAAYYNVPEEVEGQHNTYLTEQMQLLWIRRKPGEMITPEAIEEYL